MTSQYEYPEEGELVVCTVSNVKTFGAFVSMDEYEGKEGFIHVAEVATGWVKYIRDHVREGQKIVCKVMHVDPDKGHVDLSLKQVNEHQKRETIQHWKNAQKADKLMSLICQEMGIDVEKGMADFGDGLMEKYGSLYKAFEKGAMGEKRIRKDGFDGEWIKVFVKIAKTNITPPSVKVTGIFELTHPGGEGVDRIKDAIRKGMEGADEEEIHIQYLGAPRYRLEIIAEDYKEAETMLRSAVDGIVAPLVESGGKGEFTRDEQK